MIYQLEAMHDARKSFYGKALVESGGGTLTLYSYGAKVAETQGGRAASRSTRTRTTARPRAGT